MTVEEQPGRRDPEHLPPGTQHQLKMLMTRTVAQHMEHSPSDNNQWQQKFYLEYETISNEDQ